MLAQYNRNTRVSLPRQPLAIACTPCFIICKVSDTVWETGILRVHYFVPGERNTCSWVKRTLKPDFSGDQKVVHLHRHAPHGVVNFASYLDMLTCWEFKMGLGLYNFILWKLALCLIAYFNRDMCWPPHTLWQTALFIGSAVQWVFFTVQEEAINDRLSWRFTMVRYQLVAGKQMRSFTCWLVRHSSVWFLE